MQTIYEKSFGYNNLTEENPQITSVFQDKEKWHNLHSCVVTTQMQTKPIGTEPYLDLCSEIILSCKISSET